MCSVLRQSHVTFRANWEKLISHNVSRWYVATGDALSQVAVRAEGSAVSSRRQHRKVVVGHCYC